MSVRRVVTGFNSEGKSIVVSDESVPTVRAGLAPGTEWHDIWGVDEPASLPDDGTRPRPGNYFPPSGGFRFSFFSLPVRESFDFAPDFDLVTALEEFEVKFPGLAGHMEPDSPGMHTSATVDCGVVLSGEATMELDDGTMVTMKSGDTFVQNGTRHRWLNLGTERVVMAIVLVGADHAGVVNS